VVNYRAIWKNIVGSWLIGFCLSASLAAQGLVPSHAKLDGLQALYRGNNGVTDSGYWGLHATVVHPAIAFVENRKGISKQAIYANGSGTYAEIPHNSRLALGSNATLAAWILDTASASGFQSIMVKQTTARTLYNWGVSFDTAISKKGKNKIYIARQSSTSQVDIKYSADTIPRGKWVHVAVTVSNDSVEFWINGKPVGCLKDTNSLFPLAFGTKFKSTVSDTVCPIRIANNLAGNAGFRGRIDELAVVNRKLSACELIALIKENPLIQQKPYIQSTIATCGVDSLTLLGAVGLKKYAWSTGANSNKVVLKKSGKIVLNAEDSAGCKFTDTLGVKFGNPKFNFNSDSLIHTDCKRDSFRLGVGSRWKSVAWNMGSTDSVIFLRTTGIYKVLLSDSNDCYTADSIVYINQGKAKLKTVAVDSTSCFGASQGKAEVTVLGGFSPFQVQWNDASNQVGLKASGLKAGIYRALLMDKYGCKDSVNLEVKEPGKLSVVQLKIDSVSCFGKADAKIEVRGDAGTFPYTYSWNDPLAQTSATLTNVVAGAYTVKVTDSKGCMEVQGFVVGEPAKLKANVAKIDSIRCFGEKNGAVYAMGSGGNGIYSFLWSDAMSQVSSGAVGLVPGYYVVKITDQKGCWDTVGASVKQPLRLKLSLVSVDSSRCFKSYTGRAKIRASGGNGNYRFAWDDSNLQQDSVAIALISGMYECKVTDSKGCLDSISASIKEPSKVGAIFLNRDSVRCFGESNGILRVSAVGGVGKISYRWNDALNQTTAVADSLKSGSYWVWAIDQKGCKDSLWLTVLEPTQVRFSVLNVDSVNCFGGKDGSIRLGFSGGTAPLRWTWLDSLPRKSLSAYNLKSSNYRVNGLDAKGCKDSVNVFVPEPSILNINFDRIDSVRCFQGRDGAAYASVSGGNGGYRYLWNKASIQDRYFIDSCKAGIYTLQVVDLYGCNDKDSLIIPEYTRVQVAINRVDSVSCYGYTDGRIFTKTVGGTGFYRWVWNTVPMQNTDSAVGLKRGKYKVWVQDNYGCADSLESDVFEPDSMWVKISTNRYTMKGELLPLRCDIFPVKSYRYSWEPLSTFGISSKAKDPNMKFQQSTFVKLSITDARNCVVWDTATVEVVLPIRLIMHNAFSPDGDGDNEEFGLPDIFETLELVIYNRMGQEVFRGDAQRPRWDGRVNGQEAELGSYFYTVRGFLKGTEQTIQYGGSVTLVR